MKSLKVITIALWLSLGIAMISKAGAWYDNDYHKIHGHLIKEICLKGVSYYVAPDKLAPVLNRDGSLQYCE